MRIDPRHRRWVGLAAGVLALLAIAVLWQRPRLWRQLQSTALELERRDLSERLTAAQAALDPAQIEDLERALAVNRAELEQRQPEIARLRTERRALARREQQAARRVAARERQALRELIDDHDQRLAALHAGYEEARQELAEARFPVDQLQERLAASASSSLLRLLPESVRPWLDTRLEPRQVVAEGIFRSTPHQDRARVDRCQTCHLGAEDRQASERPAPFASHPQLDLYVGEDSPHPASEIGCTVCHGGEGLATDFSRAGHRPEGATQAEQWRLQWGWRPMVAGATIRAGQAAQAGCVSCHLAEGEVPTADLWQQGRRIAAAKGCTNCHGGGVSEPERPNHGPPLDRLARKTTLAWIDRWLATAPEARRGTAMPHFFDTADPATDRALSTARRALASYLWESSRGGELPSPPAGDAAVGEGLYATIGCAACHDPAATSAMGWPVAAPVLGDGPQASAGKLTANWLYAWLRKPTEMVPATHRPDLRLSTAEAADLTAFLLAGAPADSAPRPIDTEMRDQLVRAALEDELGLEAGQARFERLADHDRTLELGRRTAVASGCAACHLLPGVVPPPALPPLPATIARLAPDQDGAARLRHALKSHGEATNSAELGLTDAETNAVVVYLSGLDRPRIEPRRTIARSGRTAALAAGRRLVEEFGCRACHELEGRGGLGQNAPRLDIAGHRARSDWLFNYLGDPSMATLRPQLDLRMPTYALDDANRDRLVAYFAALADRPVLESPPRTPTRQKLAVGAAVYRILQCDGCHGGGDGAQPRYLLVPDRLRSQWVEQLILDPQRWLPDSGMPSAFASREDGGRDATFLTGMLGAPVHFDTRQRLARAFDDSAEMEAYLSDADRVARALTAHLQQLER